MKTILLSLSLISLLGLSSCLSMAVDARAGLGCDVGVGERLRAAAFDVVTLPVQIPALALSRSAEAVSYREN